MTRSCPRSAADGIVVGLDYFGARYLSGAQGRFTGVDPDLNIGWHVGDPQGWNGYGYGRNNPLKYVDPDGNDYRVCEVDENGKEFNCGVVQSNDQNNTEPFEQYAQSQGWYTQGSALYDANGNQIGTATWFNGAQERADAAAAEFLTTQVGGFVDFLGKGLKFGASLAFPLTNLAVDLTIGRDSKASVAQAAMSRKPGSLGQFKGADALRQENKVARDIIKQLNLTGKNAEAVHELISEASIDAGRKLTFSELLAYVKEVLGLL